ncbi:Uncharacterised protein [Mycobacteroides abscessus]|uniref:hypothetical protein n=1 Tax=Mycobacteroides TaxID=670516 RepID=UPI0005DBB506|nr:MULTISPECIES: hypothetical protein [Mycobacteroides]GLE54873.1 hypothetical protein NJBCHELONAE_01840 [Mycobacteroides chelonae]CPX20664.1 Uncharacterised protein [Mycobacteroides abscessus]CRG61239.1 Uncharacterised protein [Mycobacteroides abscessus]
MTSKLDDFQEALAELDAAVTEHRDAVAHMHKSYARRTAAIRHARKVGITPGDIARRIGLTQPRVTHLTVGRDAAK